MTTETAPGALAYISAGFTFAVLLVILVGTAVRLIRRSNRRRNRRRNRPERPDCDHPTIVLNACDDAVCAVCQENLT